MHPQQLCLRPALPQDRPAIMRILTQALEAYGIELPADYVYNDIDDIERAYMVADGVFMVLTRDRRLIGFFGLVPLDSRRVALRRLYLHAAERGKGLGDHLIRTAMETARQLGFAVMHLETTSKYIEAVGLYRKHGFVQDPGAEIAAGHDVALMKVL